MHRALRPDVYYLLADRAVKAGFVKSTKWR